MTTLKHILLGTMVLTAAGIATVCKADNPIIQTHFSPDPAPVVFNNTLYSYSGDDVPGTGFFLMTKWRIASTTDMVNWTDYGSPLSLESFSWAHDRAWAAQCIERNGKYYWYICVQSNKNNMAIGVAVGDSPTGPFKDAIGKPLIITGSWDNIDPTAFIDDDGQAYLYWGNGGCYYVKLNNDMISYSGEIVKVPTTYESFGGSRGNRDVNKPNRDSYVEGPWFFKRNSKYYLMFAGMSGRGGESLSYSMSDSPTGPWNYVGKIMADQKTNSSTNHGGVIDYKGKSYLFYHTGLLPGGESFGRASCVEEFTYNADGTIPTISMTKEGPSPIGTLNPYKRVEAETMAWSEKCKTDQTDATGVYITDTRMKGYIKVRCVDFGKTAPKSISASIAAGVGGGILDVRLDSLSGPKVASIKTLRTGGWLKWKLFTEPLSQEITGQHDLFFCFNGENITAGRQLFNFDYWTFTK
jgi:arabinoxylan arabinofuranohydrolase